MKLVNLKAEDNYLLGLHIFEVENAKAIIQIVHGMEEHQERYEELINFLNKNKYTVVSSNLRGHGKNAPILGHFKDRKGYLELINDQKIITNYIEETYKNKPIYILAHSMGTIITRVLLRDYSKHYTKVILSGYPNFQLGAYMGIVVSNIIKFFKGAKYKSKFLSNLSIGQFNKVIKNTKTQVDWLSYNEENVVEYINDPYCGIGFTCSAFNDLYHLVIKMNNVKKYHDINKNLEFLFLRGEDDPCTGETKGAEKSREVLKKAGFSKIAYIDYPKMRHEILAEKKKDEVYKDVLNFFNK